MDPAPGPVDDPDQRAPRRHRAVGVPALALQHHGAHTTFTGLLDRSALYGVLAEIEALELARTPRPPPTWASRCQRDPGMNAHHAVADAEVRQASSLAIRSR